MPWRTSIADWSQAATSAAITSCWSVRSPPVRCSATAQPLPISAEMDFTTEQHAMSKERPRPTREQIQAAFGKGVRNVIAPNLKVLFVGINPGLYTAAIGHHFG